MSLEDRLYPLLRLYEKAPEGVRQFVGGTYRMLPNRVRLGKAYGDFRKLIQSSESWDLEEIQEYQLKELRRTLHHANAHCPYYQRRFAEVKFQPEFLTSLVDLQAVPLLEKRDIQEHLDELASEAIAPSQRLHITTGGSTGAPVGFYLQKGVSRPKEQAFLEAMWKRAGYFDGARLAVIRGHVTSSRAAGKILSRDYTRDWLMLSSYHLTQDRLEEYLEAIENFKPDLIHAYPSAALQLAEYLESKGQTWRTPLKGMLCGSEWLTDPQKRLLERIFGCRVYRWYGHSERVVLAGEGALSDLFYFFPTYGFVEFGEPDKEGLSEIIGTSFHNMAMPLIRYRTGDYARIVRSNSGVELEFPWDAAIEFAGRGQEFLISASGRKISLTAFNMHDRIFDDLFAVQFYQAQVGEAEFRYVPGPRFDPARESLILERIREKLGDDFNVTLKVVQETEKTDRGKLKWLVSRINS